MAIYKKVSEQNDVMTFCGEKKPMGLRIIRIIQNGACHSRLRIIRIIRISKTEDAALYTNYTNFPMLTQRAPIRIIRLIRSL